MRGLVFATALSLAGGVATNVEAAAELACELGGRMLAVLVKESLGRPILLSDRTPNLFRLDVKTGAPPHVIAAWNAATPVNLFAACPELRARVPANVTFATAADWAEVGGLSSARGVFITELAAPVAAPDGRSWLTQTSYACAGLCGGGQVFHYRREGRGWAEPKLLALWMS